MKKISAIAFTVVLALMLCACGDVIAKAEAGNTNAMIDAGYMYEHGDGVEQDYLKALELYTKAAEGGNAMGMYNVACMYNNGDGVEQDLEKAFMYFYDAAEHGYADAQEFLGSSYSSGTPYTSFMDEWVIKQPSFYQKTINEFTEEEYAERIKALNIKYPDALNIMSQVSTIVVRDADGDFKIIQTLERWKKTDKIIKFYDLFTEAFLFDLPYDSEDDFFGEDNRYDKVDINKACNKIPYFDDKEIFEYGLCGYSTYFTHYHLDDLSEQAGVDYIELDYESITYMYPESYQIADLKYTTEQIADNYLKTVPVNLQVTAQELGVEITYPEERKYADAWKISDEQRAERYSKLNVVEGTEDEVVQMSQVYYLTLMDAEQNFKMLPVQCREEGTELSFYSLPSEQILFVTDGADFGEYDYDKSRFNIDLSYISKIVPYFEDKEFISIDACFAPVNYMYSLIDEQSASGISYDYPDAGFVSYVFPDGDFTTDEVECSLREVCEHYVTTVPLEMQVYDEELKVGLTILN